MSDLSTFVSPVLTTVISVWKMFIKVLLNEQQHYVKGKHIFKVSKLLSKGCNRGDRGKSALAEPLFCAR